jgi:MSHA biogenesis protein MshO
MRPQKGFTLIELITVIVVLSILAAFSSQFIVTSLDSYSTGKRTNDLTNKGRTALEQIARYLRSAVPNSARVSSTGNCLELMPSVAGAFYEGQVSDRENGASSTSSLTTSPFTLGLGNAQYVVIGALDSSEIYSNSASLVSISSTSGNPITGVSFSIPQQFVRNSIQQRVYIGDYPKRFCVSGGDLLLYENYGLVTSSMNDGNPGGTSAIIAENVTSIGDAFSLSLGTENRNASVDISLQFTEGSLQVALNQTVLIRNVP